MLIPYHTCSSKVCICMYMYICVDTIGMQNCILVTQHYNEGNILSLFSLNYMLAESLCSRPSAQNCVAQLVSLHQHCHLTDKQARHLKLRRAILTGLKAATSSGTVSCVCTHCSEEHYSWSHSCISHSYLCSCWLRCLS